jgi:hypothetical protein
VPVAVCMGLLFKSFTGATIGDSWCDVISHDAGSTRTPARILSTCMLLPVIAASAEELRSICPPPSNREPASTIQAPVSSGGLL